MGHNNASITIEPMIDEIARFETKRCTSISFQICKRNKHDIILAVNRHSSTLWLKSIQNFFNRP